MAQTPDLSVARAVFTTSLLRSESPLPEVSRENATLFAKTLDKTCNICSRANVKLCTQFITKFILGSAFRTSALAKYLVAMSKAFCPRDLSKRVVTANPGDENEGLGKIVSGRIQQPPYPELKRLHAVYIIHDVLLHIHNHLRGSDDAAQRLLRQNVIEPLRPTVVTLLELAACASTANAAKTVTLLKDVLALWRKTELFSLEQIEQMHERILAAEKSEWDHLLVKLAVQNENQVVEKTQEKTADSKWLLPDRHGVIDDPTAPWHELPSANGLYLKRTRGYPLRAYALPQSGFQLRNGGQEADPELRRSVETLVNDVKRCYDKYTNSDDVQDIDALGNIIWKDPERPTRNYWGFTIDGIDRRKELGKRFAETAIGYDDVPYNPVRQINNDVERARALAVEMGRGRGGRGRGFGRGGWQRGHGRGGW